MATKFKSSRTLKQSVRRIARTLIDCGLEKLAVTDPAERDEAVHDVRKSLKKLRALLRLVRPVTGRRIYQRENACFRESGRPLAEIRDAKILIETLDSVVRDEPLSEEERWAVDELRESLVDRLSALHLELRHGDVVLTIHGDLAAAWKRVKNWSDVPERWRTIGRGLEATYAAAATARQAASAAGTMESLHEWRKQVRYVHEQLTFVRFLDRFRVKQLGSQADQINTLLGTTRDLSLLAQAIETHSTLEVLPELKSRLIEQVRRKRSEAVEDALRMGEAFFRETPAVWVAAFKQDWKRQRDFAEGRRRTGDQLVLPFAGRAS